MNEKRYFLRIHPLPAFVFFVAALTVTMMSMHPVVLAASFVCAVVFCGFLYGVKKTASSLAYTFPLMVLVILVNMAFVHRGETYLFFLNDNPVTLEALLYGVAMSVMFAAIYYWCKCMTAVMTTDKWIFLFGKILRCRWRSCQNSNAATNRLTRLSARWAFTRGRAWWTNCVTSSACSVYL